MASSSTTSNPENRTRRAFIKYINRSLRNEVLDHYLFRNLQQVRERVNRWRAQYNERRPHDA